MNELVKYESSFGLVELTPKTVKDYLVKGNGDVSDQEVTLFIEMCKAQKLNPFVTGEAYLIKFGQQPAQMVIGYDTYKRRAEENPLYLCKESGIIVQRGGEIVQKEGACLYPSESLLGGWCRVHKMKGQREVTTYKEVGFNEYNKGNAIWKEKPCTMIEKVAISQALREAFPKDYEGMYTAEELAPAEYAVVVGADEPTEPGKKHGEEQVKAFVDAPITQDERKALFSKARDAFGTEKGNEIIKSLLADRGIQSTTGMMKTVYLEIMEELDQIIEDSKASEEEPENTDTDEG